MTKTPPANAGAKITNLANAKAPPAAEVHRSSRGHLSQAIIRAAEPIIGHLCPSAT
jgi:hypothetical protein